MKKLMIAAAIVCAAAFTQAAQIKWNVSGVTAKETEKPTGYTAYFFIASAPDDSVAAGKLITLAQAEAYAAEGNIAALAAAATMTGNLDKYGSVTTSLTPANDLWVKYSTIESFAIVLNNEIPDAATYYNVALDTDLEPAGYSSVTFASDTAKPTAYVMGGDWAAISAVPEPTSGLLLLLGVAGLALRRRRA